MTKHDQVLDKIFELIECKCIPVPCAERIPVIGLWGPGLCGKSRLTKKLTHHKFFEGIAFETDWGFNATNSHWDNIHKARQGMYDSPKAKDAAVAHAENPFHRHRWSWIQDHVDQLLQTGSLYFSDGWEPVSGQLIHREDKEFTNYAPRLVIINGMHLPELWEKIDYLVAFSVSADLRLERRLKREIKREKTSGHEPGFRARTPEEIGERHRIDEDFVAPYMEKHLGLADIVLDVEEADALNEKLAPLTFQYPDNPGVSRPLMRAAF